jgi:pimeloyl-ACP methyl ester carboxylesterase
MKAKFIFILFFYFNLISFAQSGKFPYPVIFLHGFVSSDDTWNDAVTYFGGEAKIFDVCLNHDGNNSTASLTNDVNIIGWRDGNSNPSPNRLYVINFDNTRFAEAGHSTHNFSNQAAIYKQGVALKSMIQAVLEIEDAEKVFLVGHSMGGLEAREYLQRGFDGTNSGRGINWVDQSSEDGHKVAKLISLGTPHLGSNHTGGILSAILNGADEKSEACRDLRYPYSTVGPFPVTVPAPFLFGGIESSFQWSSTPYNKDVNCNGSQSDNITGLNSGTTYNNLMPLPLNILYTWITSNFNNLGQDGLVELSRQYLYSGSSILPATADTLLINTNHIFEPNNIYAIIRGLDEPSGKDFSYKLIPNTFTTGFITYNTNRYENDIDVFNFTPTLNGSLSLIIVNNNAGIDSFEVLDDDNVIYTNKITNQVDTFYVENILADKKYYIKIFGTTTSTSWQNPYSIGYNVVTPDGIRENIYPDRFVLEQNYPNPFNPSTKIRWQSPVSGHQTLKIYDVLGNEIAKLVDEYREAGKYEIEFNATGLSSGVYFYKLVIGNFTATRKLILMR